MAAAVNPRIIRECPHSSWENQAGAYEVTNSIPSTMTPQQFDELTRRNPDYRIDHGGRSGYTALEIAIENGNLPLVLHIIVLGQIANINVVNLIGNQVTPLIDAIDCCNDDVGYKIVQALIQAGADVNMCTKTTKLFPLFLAVHIRHSERLARLLLRHGAFVADKLEDFQRARSVLDNIRTPDQIADANRNFQRLCVEEHTWSEDDLRIIKKAQEPVPSLMQLSALSARTGKVDLNDPYLPTEIRAYVLEA